MDLQTPHGSSDYFTVEGSFKGGSFEGFIGSLMAPLRLSPSPWIQGLGFTVWGLGFLVQGLGRRKLRGFQLGALLPKPQTRLALRRARQLRQKKCLKSIIGYIAGITTQKASCYCCCYSSCVLFVIVLILAHDDYEEYD